MTDASMISPPSVCGFCHKVFAETQSLQLHLNTPIKDGGCDAIVEKRGYPPNIEDTKKKYSEL